MIGDSEWRIGWEAVFLALMAIFFGLFQIPGKLLFSLVKRYLCVTALMGKLTAEPGGEEVDSVPSPANCRGQKRMQREFDFSMAMGHLISELAQVMGWDRDQEHKERWPRLAQSIFQPQVLPTSATFQSATHLPQKEISTFKTRSAFPSCSGYVEYMKEMLVRGMRVRMLEDYEKVCAGDEGEFLHSNNGTPPVQVLPVAGWSQAGRCQALAARGWLALRFKTW